MTIMPEMKVSSTVAKKALKRPGGTLLAGVGAGLLGLGLERLVLEAVARKLGCGCAEGHERHGKTRDPPAS